MDHIKHIESLRAMATYWKKKCETEEAENARLRTALHDAINRPKGVVPDSALELYDATVCPDCSAGVTWYHDAEGVSRAVCKNKCKGWKVLREVDRHEGA